MVLIIKKAPTIIPVQVPATVEPKKGGIRRRQAVPSIQHTEVELFGELASIVSAIKANYSPAVITRANHERQHYGRLASGILSLDLCLAGGLMQSRGSMIYGNKSAGKSTVSYRFIAAAQRLYPDKYVALVDIEGTFDPVWAKMHGCDLDRLLIIEPETGESAVDMADALLRAVETSLLITDSIAFLTPMKEIQNSAEDSFPGMHARLIGNYLRRLNTSLLTERHRGHFPTILHLNQFRMSIGVTFGDPRVLPGGRALEFATTQQVELSNKEHTNAEKGPDGKKKPAQADASGEKADKNTTVVFNEHTIKITKDKSGGRYKEGKFKLIRDESQGLPVGYIDQARSIQQFGLASGLFDGALQSFGFRDPNRIVGGFRGKFRGAPELTQWLLEDHTRELAVVSAIVEDYRVKWGVT